MSYPYGYGSYDVPTQFGFPASQVGVLPSTMDQVNPAWLPQIKAFLDSIGGWGRLASVSGIRLYDQLRFDPGVIPLQTFTYFQNGIGQQQSPFNATTIYRKQNIDTTYWTDNGKLSKGYEALIWSIQFIIQLPNAIDQSVQDSGNTAGLTLVPGTQATAGAAIQAGNYMRAILESMYAELFLNNTTFEHGPISLFPSSYGVGNAIGVFDGGADGAWSNTVGWCYTMPVMRHIPELTKFGVRLSNQNAWENDNGASPAADGLNFRLMCVLDGIGVQPITG